MCNLGLVLFQEQKNVLEVKSLQKKRFRRLQLDMLCFDTLVRLLYHSCLSADYVAESSKLNMYYFDLIQYLCLIFQIAQLYIVKPSV